MNQSYHGWLRVSKVHPCPVCGSFDWCLVTEDGSAAICPRTSEGADRDLGDAGFLHRITAVSNGSRLRSIPLRLREPNDAVNTMSVMATSFTDNVTAADLNRFAEALSVTPESLRRLRVGWSPTHRAWSFPMVDASGAVLGIRLRSGNGDKFSVSGGHHGLHVPNDLGNPMQLVLSEGPTDCAALLDLGFTAVGRPSCRGATQFTCDLVKQLNPQLVIIVADNDEIKRDGRRPGIEGATQLAKRLALRTCVKIIMPPTGIKDARAWKSAGATASDVTAIINAAPAQRISLVLVGGGR